MNEENVFLQAADKVKTAADKAEIAAREAADADEAHAGDDAVTKKARNTIIDVISAVREASLAAVRAKEIGAVAKEAAIHATPDEGWASLATERAADILVATREAADFAEEAANHAAAAQRGDVDIGRATIDAGDAASRAAFCAGGITRFIGNLFTSEPPALRAAFEGTVANAALEASVSTINASLSALESSISALNSRHTFAAAGTVKDVANALHQAANVIDKAAKGFQAASALSIDAANDKFSISRLDMSGLDAFLEKERPKKRGSGVRGWLGKLLGRK